MNRLYDTKDELLKLRRVIAWANNSLFGSHGFFLSLDGGEDNEHHLDTAIEKLKQYGRQQYQRAEALSTLTRPVVTEAMVEAARELLAAEVEESEGDSFAADMLRKTGSGIVLVEDALRAIAKALANPLSTPAARETAMQELADQAQALDMGYGPASEKPEAVEEFLDCLVGWERAYPLSAFPEPDFEAAAKALKDAGMTLDAISASNMRRVISILAPMARHAIDTLSTAEA